MQPPGAKVMVNITNKTVIRTIVWVIIAVLLYKFIGRISHELTLIFISAFLALALNPVVGWLSKRLKIKSRSGATAIAYLLIVLILTGFFMLITPLIVRQTRDFINQVPETVQNFQSQDSTIARAVRRYNLDQKLEQGAKDFTAHYSNFGNTLLDTGKRVADAVVSFIVVIFLTFMMLVEGPHWFRLYFSSLSPKTREHHQKLARRMYRSITGFVDGQVVMALVAGLLAFVALEIASQVLNVAINSIALAGIVAMFGIIPLFGNPIAATLVVLICLLNSPTLALVMLIYFIIYFFVENHTLQPIVQSHFNELTPLTVFIAAILGVGFGGFLGAIIAIPAASTVKILIEDHFERRGAKRVTQNDLAA